MDYSITAIILSSGPSGENDEIFTMLSPKLGRFQAKAKSSKKITSKLKMSLQEFSLVKITLTPTWRSFIPTIIGCETIEQFQKIKTSPLKIFLAMSLAEIAFKASLKNYAGDFIFNLFLRALKKINQLSEKNARLQYYNFVYFFSMRIFQDAGVAPETKKCVSCGQKERLTHFDAQRGGVICFECGARKKTAIAARKDILKIINDLKKQRWNLVSHLRLTNFQTFVLNKIFADFYQAHFYQKLLSPYLIPV